MMRPHRSGLFPALPTLLAASGCVSLSYTEYVENEPLRAPVKVQSVEPGPLLVLADARRVRPRLSEEDRDVASLHRISHEGRECVPTVPPECVEPTWRELVARNYKGWERQFAGSRDQLIPSGHLWVHKGRPCCPPVPPDCADEVLREQLERRLSKSKDEVDLENEVPQPDGTIEADVYYRWDLATLLTCGTGLRPSLNLFPRRVPRYERRRLGER